MQFSLLDDPLIRVRHADGRVASRSLPQVLDALHGDDVLAFEALQPHQHQAWYSFLVQLAAMAVTRETGGDTPPEPTGWRTALVGLADDSEAAWHLVVKDLARPAFMQPPVPEGSLEEAGYKADIETPDQLDVLVTSKNHDVKRKRILHPRPEHWFYALLTLQTMEGFLGRGNYGIVRMNGGFGNRPAVGLASGLSWGQRFRRDVNVLSVERGTFAGRYDLDAGHTLLWIEPWDGAKTSGIPLAECDPYFLEICRRIRLLRREQEVTCWRANTRGQRVAAPTDWSGDSGDPWTPVDKTDAKALTVGEAGFAYDLLQQILFGGEYASPITLEFRESEAQGAYLIARALARGQGKTNGLHHRIIPIPQEVTGRLFRQSTEREALAERSAMRVRLAADVQRKVLYPAIAALLSSGRDEKVDWQKVQPWTQAFERAVDARFFESLWASVHLDEEAARGEWERLLFTEAEAQFEGAEGGTPIAAIHRWRAVSEARSIFYARARDVLPHAFRAENSTDIPREEATTHGSHARA